MPSVLLLMGVAVTLYGYQQLREHERKEYASEFERQVANHFAVVRSVEQQQDILIGSIQNLFLFSENVTLEGFRGATRLIQSREPGLKWIDWAPRVTSAERARFETSVRGGRFPDFQIHDPSPPGEKVISPQRPEHFPLLYTGARPEAARGVGLDLASNARLLKRIYDARDKLEGMVVTDVSAFRQVTNQAALTVVVPTYEPGRPLATIEDRREHFTGCLLVVFGMRDLVERHTDVERSQGVDWLMEASLENSKVPLHFHPAETPDIPIPIPTASDMRAGLHQEESLRVAGMDLTLIYRPSTAMGSGKHGLFPETFLAGGIGFSFLLFAYLTNLTRRRQAIEAEVRRQTEELRTASKLIRSSEARFQQYMDNSPVVAWLKDEELRLRYVNKTFRKLFEMDPNKTVSGMSDFDYLSKDVADSVRRNDKQVLERGKSVQAIENVPGADGVMRHWLVTKFPFQGADGKRWVGGTAFDVTERERVANALAESEQRLKSISDHLPEAIVYQYCMGPDGKDSFNYLSAGVERVTEYSSETVYADPSKAFANILPEDLPGMRAATEKSARELVPFNHEFRRKLPDGQVRWYNSRSMPRKLPGGATVWDGVEVDITAHKSNELMLAWEREALQLIAGDHSLYSVLDGLMKGLEKLAPGSICSVLLLDADGIHLRHGAGPSLPKEYNRAIDGVAIGPKVGSCGTAAYTGKQVIVQCIEKDPLWADFKDLALRHHLAACWSTPVLNREGRVLGTFAVYYREIKAPTSTELELIDRACQIVRIAIEQHLTEESLRLARQREDLHREQTPLGVIHWDLDFTVREWNPAAAHIFGYSSEEAIGRHARFIIPTAFHEHVDAIWDSLLTNCGGTRSTNDNVRKDGGFIQCEWYNTPLVDDHGKVIGVASLVQEVTEQRKAQEALRQERNLLRTLIDRLPESIYLKDRLGAFMLVNEASRVVLGLPDCEAAVGKTVYDFFPKEIADQFAADDQNVFASRVPVLDREEPFIDAEGKSGMFLTSKLPLVGNDGTVLGLVGISRDVTERKRAEEELKRLNASLEQAQSTAKLGSWDLDPGKGVGWWSSEMYRLFDFDPAKGCPPLELFLEKIHPDDRQAIRDSTRRSAELLIKDSVQFRSHPGLGPLRYFEGASSPKLDAKGVFLMLSGTVQEITDRVRAEEERERIQQKLEETQKLESLGVLAGGIAHDFNNLLTGILGNASLLRMELPASSPMHSGLADIERASLRAADLCRQMLAYAGKGRLTVKAIDLSALVRESEQLLRLSISKSVGLNLRLAGILPAVSADETQLRQILMNLVINASEAIGGGEGLIIVTTSTLRLTAADIADMRLAGDMQEGCYVSLEVSDNGCGMDAMTLGRIFDPFFTTKFLGRGLGLAAVLGIIRSHKGGMKVYSEPGKGTTFKLLLPCVEGPADKLESTANAAGTWKGSGTVLVVDDEETVRKATRRMLENLGFQVVDAADGIEGLLKFRELRLRLNLVLLDLTMPRMDGVETFREMRRERPDVKVLLMSGFSEQEAVSRFTGKGLAGFIQKPFKSADLSRKIQEVLEIKS